MSEASRLLVSMPAVLQFESPSSWITRAALAQGVDVREMLAYLGINPRADCDRAFLGDDFRRIARICGVNPNAFAVARKILEVLGKVERGRTTYLMTSGEGGRLRYRYCPRCMSEQLTPYHAIHCRFEAWRYCPLHSCLLEDSCWHCKAMIVLPASVVSTGTTPGMIAYLSQCFRCGRSHGRAPVLELNEAESVMRGIDRMQLENGRATLAALHQRRVLLEGGVILPISRLRKLERMGLIPSKGRGPTAEGLRERVRTREA
jgi:hypothetical protein